MPPTTASYAFDNAASQTGARFNGLESTLDPMTVRRLGVLPVEAGWSCLEVGAGGGSIARWLSQRVGPTGRVLATDVNLDWFDGAAPNVESRVHDIVHDPLPPAAFDLVHARHVLGHLPERDAVLRRLVQTLRPGGWVLVEDFDRVLPACQYTPTDRERLVNRVGDALVDFLALRGTDTTYPRELPWRLLVAGFTEVGAAGHVEYATGGSPAAEILRANVEQVGDAIIESGLASRRDVDRYVDVMTDTELIFHLPLFVSAWGRRPA